MTTPKQGDRVAWIVKGKSPWEGKRITGEVIDYDPYHDRVTIHNDPEWRHGDHSWSRVPPKDLEGGE